MMPPAPALFSMMKGLPRSSDIFAVMARATMSTAPPAGNGSSRRIGRSGYSAKLALAPASHSANASTMRTGPIGLFAVEVEIARGCAKNLCPRGRVGNGIDQPVDGGLIGEMALMADKRAVARPHQPIGAGDADKLARILRSLWPEPVAAGHFHPGAPPVDRAQQRLEAVAVDPRFRIGAAEM